MKRITRLAGLAAAGIAVAAAGLTMNSASAAQAPAPATQGEGNYLVGAAGLKPGVYTASGKGYCYWSRFEALASGKLVHVKSGEQPWVEIRKTDTMFYTHAGCGDWTREGDESGLGSLGGLDFGSLGPVGSSDDAPKSPPPWTTPTTVPYPTHDPNYPPFSTGYPTTTTAWTTPTYMPTTAWDPAEPSQAPRTDIPEPAPAN